MNNTYGAKLSKTLLKNKIETKLCYLQIGEIFYHHKNWGEPPPSPSIKTLQALQSHIAPLAQQKFYRIFDIENSSVWSIAIPATHLVERIAELQ